MDGALEAVEHMRAAIARHFECFVIVVSTDLADRHASLLATAGSSSNIHRASQNTRRTSAVALGLRDQLN
jgi:hypothetical protein